MLVYQRVFLKPMKYPHIICVIEWVGHQTMGSKKLLPHKNEWAYLVASRVHQARAIFSHSPFTDTLW